MSRFEIMTDFALAAEIRETATWILARNANDRVVAEHVDRLTRAIRFLQGERARASLEPAELKRLLQNDPTIAAVYAVARRDAYEQARIEFERPRSLRVEIDPSIPPGEIRAIDDDSNVLGRITGIGVPCGDFVRPLGASR